ncbi:Protein of unknown function (DUF4005) [Orobanche hederae]
MMGKNNGNSWLNAVKKAFKSPSQRTCKRKEEHDQEEEEEEKRGKRRWIFGKHFPIETTIQHKVAKAAISLCTSGHDVFVEKQPKMESYSVSEQNRAIAVAEAALANAVEIIRRSKTAILAKQHEAALVIQTLFRGYLLIYGGCISLLDEWTTSLDARRALLALKGVVRMQAIIRGHNARKRAKMTLQCIESLVRVQALVCEQRSIKSTQSKYTAGNSSNNLDLEEIEALIQKAEQCSLKQGKTIAHILSHQKWTLDEDDQDSDSNYQGLDYKLTIHPTARNDRILCINQRDPIKTIEIDTSRPYSLTPPKPSFKYQNQDSSYFIPSPKTPSTMSYSHQTPTYLHRMSLSENSCNLARPNYMSATQSAMARVRSHSTPRQRATSSPSRQQMGSAKKRLSFPVRDEQRSNDLPYYLTE